MIRKKANDVFTLINVYPYSYNLDSISVKCFIVYRHFFQPFTKSVLNCWHSDSRLCLCVPRCHDFEKQRARYLTLPIVLICFENHIYLDLRLIDMAREPTVCRIKVLYYQLQTVMIG